MVKHTAGDAVDALVRPLLVAPVTGTAVSTLAAPFGIETVSASGPGAARADEVQLDLGEGPAWQAFRTAAPVFLPDLGVDGQAADAWPAARTALTGMGIAGVLAVPLTVGALGIGTLSLYTDEVGRLPTEAIDRAAHVQPAAARAVLEAALHRAASERPGEWSGGQYSRREVHQAVGMVAAQTGATVDDALLLLRAAAFGSDRSLAQLSAAVLDREVDFSPGGRGAERDQS
ncbi:GAF domain-containing protein [Curtobacterium luteum]|uniref:GAF domain-containing protein n=1 Tax=Curtobacterium luteum TaxID=33881 RepID=UPI003813F0C1